MQLNKLNKWQKFLGYYLIGFFIALFEVLKRSGFSKESILAAALLGVVPGLIVSVLAVECFRVIIKAYKEMSFFRFFLVLFLLYFWMINWNKYVVN